MGEGENNGQLLQVKLYDYLTEHVDLANGVYALEAPELDPVTNEKPELPYIVFSKVNQSPGYTHDGYSYFGEAWFQVSCFAGNYKAVGDLANQVLAALYLWAEKEGVQATLVDGVLDQVEPNVCHTVVTCKVWYDGE